MNIIIKGARQNNLKDIDIEIPRNKITVFVGLSGSGKSSLAFETINSEAQRQMLNSYSSFARSRLPKYSEPDVDYISGLSPSVFLTQKRFAGSSRSTLGTVTEIYTQLRLLFSRLGEPSIGSSNMFSFNSPYGMCKVCNGTGRVIDINVEKLLDKSKTLSEGAVLFPDYKVDSIYYKQLVLTGLFDMNKPISEFSEEELFNLLFVKKIRVTYSENSMMLHGNHEGIVTKLNRLYLMKDINTLGEKKVKMIKDFIYDTSCDSCHGARINQKALSVTINNKNIYELSKMSMDELSEFLETIEDERFAVIIKQLKAKVKGLIDLGIGYLSLSRETSTLSGGEAQRVRISHQLSNSLTEMIYVFDEPSVGLHSRDVHLLVEFLQKLKEKGNTVLVVEHDPEVIMKAVNIIEVGPGSGSMGGEIVFQGQYNDLLKTETITSKELRIKKSFKSNVKQATDFFRIEKASANNLKNISVNIPKGIFTVITGVAGSGKSTLINNEFVRKFENVITVNQDQVKGSNRSNPATYIGVFDEIRKLFAKRNNVSESLFSFNSKGACKTCKGKGYEEIEMAYMDPIRTVCEKCNGSRYNDKAMTYLYNGKSIVDILEMNVNEAIAFFHQSSINHKLILLKEVGLEYLKLNQPLSTLSGGESQRIKLASKLHLRNEIYVFDEPTTGLHMKDIHKILSIIDNLVSKGNTVIVIEHNLDVILHADWIIDIGPEGGNKGGEVVFEGKPYDIINCDRGHTGKRLRAYID